MAQAELEFFCADSEPVLMVHDAAWQKTAVKVAAGAGIPKIASYGVADTRYDIVSAAERARPLAARPVNRTSDANVLMYTSGTTGRPKGARCTYKSQTWQTLNVVEPYDLRPSSKYLAVLPFFHAAGLNSMTGPTLALGGTVAILPTFDPQRIVSLFSDPAQGITHFSGAPVMYQVMATTPNFDGADFSTVVHAQVGGGFLNFEVTKAFHERGPALSQVTAPPRWARSSASSGPPTRCGSSVPPVVGADTVAVLRDLGLAEAEVTRLHDAGVVASPR